MTALPFDRSLLDELLERESVDALIATSPHNARYLLGGYRFFLYDRLDPIGPSRYLPVVGYLPGRVADAFYVGAGNEDWGTDAAALWVPSIHNVAWSTRDAAAAAALARPGSIADRDRAGVPPVRRDGGPCRRAARSDVRRRQRAARRPSGGEVS
jgi:hypothetical protein